RTGLTAQAMVDFQLGDLAAACDKARAALKQDPKDAKAAKIEQSACRGDLKREPKDPKEAAAAKTFSGDVMHTSSQLLRKDLGGGALNVASSQQSEEFKSWMMRITEAKNR